MNTFEEDPWNVAPRGARSNMKRTGIGIRAKLPGDLPADGDSCVGGVNVPAGITVTPERRQHVDADGNEKLSELLAPIGWYTPTGRGTTNELWWDLARAFTRTGLWPVVGGGERCGSMGPYTSQEPPSRDHGNEAANALQRCWDGMRFVNRETGEPLPERRPLFPGVPAGAPPEDFIEWLTDERGEHWGAGYAGVEAGILLVPASQPAQVPRLVGWSGACNYFIDGHDTSAVLGSWEERYGAVLYQLGGTTLTLRVARPPATLAEARIIMEEHYLLCTDNFYPQDFRPPLSPEDYARRLVNAPVWDFWWD
ncbi:DUF4253 domain-containing protein [Arthrobacter sp. Sr24]